jgi:hypothetical protein
MESGLEREKEIHVKMLRFLLNIGKIMVARTLVAITVRIEGLLELKAELQPFPVQV